MSARGLNWRLVFGFWGLRVAWLITRARQACLSRRNPSRAARLVASWLWSWPIPLSAPGATLQIFRIAE